MLFIKKKQYAVKKNEKLFFKLLMTKEDTWYCILITWGMENSRYLYSKYAYIMLLTVWIL